MVFVTLGVTLEAIVAKALTAVAIEKIKPGTARQEVPDKQIPGLYLVVQVSGKKSWAVRYRFGCKSCKLTLGQYPAIDLKTARKRAWEARDKVAEGKDPGAEKKAAKAAASIPANDLVDAVADRFLAQYVKRNLKPSTCREVNRILNKVVVPAWEGRRLSEVRRPDVHDLLDEIVARGSPIAANRTLSWFRRMCAWAIERGIIETSPCDKVKAPSTETSRDRVLSDGELAAVWRAAGALEPPYGAFVGLLVLTGARRNEVAGMTWRELDLDGKVWTLLAARTKNGREHLVPLSDAAVELIRGLPRIAGSEFLFTLSGRGPITAFDLTKKRIDERLPPDMTAWTYHDLRRTMASGLARLGVNLPVIEKVLNHRSGSFAGIVGVYQRHGYEDEKRLALEAWGHHVEAIVNGEPGNVVAVKARRPQ
jgi:integrase